MRMERRAFLNGGLAVAGASVLGIQAGCSQVAEGTQTVKATLLIRDAKIYTMDEAMPVAEAIAVRGNRILAIGRTADLEALVDPSTEVIDGRGLVVTPGFIDAHAHPNGIADVTGADVNVRSISELKSAMAEQARKVGADEWVIGNKYDDTKFAEGRAVTRWDLDEAVPNQPAILNHRGGHTVVVNSRGIELAGITVDTPDPETGAFGRTDGELNGFAAESATSVFSSVGKWPEVTRATRQHGVAYLTQQMAAAGLTSTTDAAGGVTSLIAFQDARDAGQLSARVSFMPIGRSAGFAGLKAAGIRSGFGDEWVRIGAVKYMADGSASERTMRMSTPYEGQPDNFGILTMTQDEITEAAHDAWEHGFRMAVHANGDVTIDMVMNAYEEVLSGHVGPSPRFRIEHCSLVTPELLTRIRDLGVIPAPFYTYAHYHGNKWVDYGPEKMRMMFAHRSFLDYGIPVAPASDYTPGPFEPLMAIQSLVTRKDFDGRVWGENQRVTVEEAMRICTMNGAHASMEEEIKGSLTPGKLADITILAADPHDVDPDDIKNIQVVRTILDGNTAYDG